jgi:hypothetical protein
VPEYEVSGRELQPFSNDHDSFTLPLRTMSAQRPIETIVLRQWASHMATPIWIAGAPGELPYYNESAEWLLGSRFDKAGHLPSKQTAPQPSFSCLSTTSPYRYSNRARSISSDEF